MIRRPFLNLQLPAAPPSGRFLHNQVLDALELDLGPRPLAEQHPVADFDVNRDELAALIATTRANGNDLLMPPLVFSSASMRLMTTRS
jgi:hypothetical protein